ncbi:alpha-N-acetylneuraminide alpha-2,8-sialyltransferase-like isoform X2 [Lethenteron reissneri]|uniref:alpha-N-acetylneuraminide alpha-2,8-sialyltransferase-like isoform X2 n=1 Tax=Lethenteron reissneri TaxID=7753 RepID=UPI002AB7D497|nr:alpha-N-acetylneuraminide alpha-2,8-sialyltransferase-like isoform X2 [Lethenteron reissneri]
MNDAYVICLNIHNRNTSPRCTRRRRNVSRHAGVQLSPLLEGSRRISAGMARLHVRLLLSVGLTLLVLVLMKEIIRLELTPSRHMKSHDMNISTLKLFSNHTSETQNVATENRPPRRHMRPRHSARRVKKIVHVQSVTSCTRPEFILKPIALPISSRDNSLLKEAISVNKNKWKANASKKEAYRIYMKCFTDGSSNIVVTQNNSPLGSNISYLIGNAQLTVGTELTNIIPMTFPGPEMKMKTCAVVGNSGFLLNSKCGKEIDKSDFIMRCNLPNISKKYSMDVGEKTNLVFVKPSLIVNKYSGLRDSRIKFVEDMQKYGSDFLFTAFNHLTHTNLAYKAFYTMDDFATGQSILFLNPNYSRGLRALWNHQGLASKYLSAGLHMTSAALEACEEVHLFGFWPMEIASVNRRGRRGRRSRTSIVTVRHSYFEQSDQESKVKEVFDLKMEFAHLLRLHTNGIIRLQLGACAV